MYPDDIHRLRDDKLKMASEIEQLKEDRDRLHSEIATYKDRAWCDKAVRRMRETITRLTAVIAYLKDTAIARCEHGPDQRCHHDA